MVSNRPMDKSVRRMYSPDFLYYHVCTVFCRHDKEYGMERRLALEEYLRAVVKIPVVKKVSYALHEFVNSEETILFTPEDMIYFEDYEREQKKRWWADDNGIIYDVVTVETVGEVENEPDIGVANDLGNSNSNNNSNNNNNNESISSSGGGSSESDDKNSESDSKALNTSENSPTNSQDSETCDEEFRNIRDTVGIKLESHDEIPSKRSEG